MGLADSQVGEARRVRSSASRTRGGDWKSSDTEFPTRELPKFDGIGANEYIVDVTHDAVDFISTVDTPAHWELNMWYHTLNVRVPHAHQRRNRFPLHLRRPRRPRPQLRASSTRLDYDQWAQGIRDGRAYVTDGKSHLIDFKVNDRLVGTQSSEVRLARPGTVRVTAAVAARLMAQPEMAAIDVDQGPRSQRSGPVPEREVRAVPLNEKPYWHLERARLGATREVPVEVIVNGRAVARTTMVADGTVRDVAFDVPIDQSSWVALRILPSSHTNPIFVVVDGKPVRASRESADWCLRAVDQCWSQKVTRIAERERPDAERAYEHARTVYRRILNETPAGH